MSNNDMPEDDLKFETLHHNYRPKILRYITQLAGEDNSEDLTQEVFIRVCASLGSFKGESRVSTWIYRIATNIAIDWFRSPSGKRSNERRRLRAASSDAESEPEDKDAWTDEKPLTAPEALARKEMRECFLEYVNKLPLNYRTVFILSDLRGMKDAEIAETLRISLGIVKIRLHRARAKIRKQLEASCGLVRDARNGLMWEGTRP
jgi:RNA polymerase sigma-70 factor (ECF subfamily)